MAYEEPKEESDKDIIENARKGLKSCVDADATERAKMKDDLAFAALDQWPSDIRNDRENDVENGARPCLTIDKYSQYRTQVVNDMRQGKPGIVVRPQDDAADVETAKILKGLVRNIEDQSNADIAYINAGGSAVDIGLGYFRITTEYVSDDSFDQEIFIRPIPNTFSTYLGPHSMPDGSDAEKGYILEAVPLEVFKQSHPKAKWEAKEFEDLSEVGYWRTEETVTVMEEFCIKKVAQELLFLADGTTMTASDYAKWPAEAGPKPEVQERRTTFKRQLKWRKLTGVEVLEKRDLPGKYIPIVEVIGRELWVNGQRIVWGMVRPAKDSLRMYNYWASTITEKMALAPKTPFVGAKGQFAGIEDKWKKANKVNFSYLEYDPIEVGGNAVPAPRRQEAMPIEAAMLKQMQVIEHDVQTSLGMFKAAVGETESQQSGRAILALQRESDTGTYHFGANLGVSIRHAGRIIVDMIPHYYDTKRIVRILGDDGEVKTAQIDPSQETAYRKIQTPEGIKSIYNPGVGKYDVSITVGPSYTTKRLEAASTFVEMAKGAADPASAAILRYLVMRNSDAAGSDEAAKLLKTMLPPQALQALDSNEPIPPAAMAKMQQMAQQMQAMQQGAQEMAQKLQQSESGQQEAMVKVRAESQARMQELELERQVENEKAILAREKAEADFALKKWIAEQEMALERQRCAHEKQVADDKYALETKVKTDALIPDEVRAAHYKQELMQNDVVPKLIEGLQGALGDPLGQMVALQERTLAATLAPKTVSISGLTRGPDGMPTGGTVNSRSI